MLADLAAYLHIGPWPQAPVTGLGLALSLVAGALLGEGAWRVFRMPRIVGYSLVGLVLGLAGYGADMLRGDTRLVVDLALALLLFELGSRVNLRWLRANPALLLTSAAESLLSFGAILLALRAVGLPLNLALTCATLGTCASGAVVARVGSEVRAAGQVHERLIVLTTLNTLVAVLGQRLLGGWLHLDVAGDWVRAVSLPLWAFGGSVLLAALMAALVAGVARRLDLRDENAALLLLGLIVLGLLAAKLLNLSTLLVPLLAGVLLRNTTDRPWLWPRHFGTAGGVLVLMMFVVVGSVASVDALLAGGAAALVMLAARAVAKSAAVLVFAPWSGLRLKQGLGLSLALLPMSGTALVLLADLNASHADFAPKVAPIIFAAIGFTEVLGPLAVQWGLRLAGELHPLPSGAAAPRHGPMAAA
jgi:Kef-type K+ transport system membrane component KefB